MSDRAITYIGEPNPRTIFVEGPFGSGKTLFAIETLQAWLEAGVPPSRILVLVPQRHMAQPFVEALLDPGLGAMGAVQVRTLGGLARDMSRTYWAEIAEEAGFRQPGQPPRFLTIETSQYAMSAFVEEAVRQGEFDALSLSPHEIARQIIDSLNKAAILQIDFRRIPEMLSAAWGSERPRKRVLAYQAAGRVAEKYRQYCIDSQLLDFSLQLELFNRLLRQPHIQADFFRNCSHLIVEHLQEEPAVTHDLIYEWLPRLEGGLLTYEWDSGYRIFLGAAPEGGSFLRQHCEGVLTFNRSFVMSPGVASLLDEVGFALRRDLPRPATDQAPAFEYSYHTYFPEMLDRAADRIAHMVTREGIPPREIAVLAPYLSDALRFSMTQKLSERGIPSISHRPSRALRDEPAARCLLTLLALAYPEWKYLPPREDVAQALALAIEALDPVRARLLAEVVYRPGAKPALSSFGLIKPDMQNRITYRVGKQYEYLREWLETCRAGNPAYLDQVMRGLFGEVLSQPGFGFHDQHEYARITDELVKSAQTFRRALFDPVQDPVAIGQQYFAVVNQGLLAGLYIESWRDDLADAVFLSPAFTFLVRNRAVSVQVWLDVGSMGWWERLDQPLTHPYVLSKDWPPGKLWTDAEEYQRQQEMLYRVVSGLIRRCRQRIYLGISDLGEQGFEERGPLLRVFQSILRRHPQIAAKAVIDG